MGNNIISSLGAGSGIDVSGLVDGLVAAEKAPKTARLDSRQEKLDTQISAYGTLKSSLSEFQNVLKPLVDADTFNARSVSFPTTDLITPNQLDANAQVGSYQMEVLSVAQAQSLASGAVADSKAALGAGDITFRFGEWTSYTEGGGPVGFTQNGDKDALTITLDAEDSLEDLVSKINDADVGLQASIIQTDGQSQLLLTTPSGADNAVEITADAALSQFSFIEGTANMTQTQAAADASLKVNGLSVTRETNDIDDVIQGLSFTLNKANEGEKVTFSISEDKNTAETAIRDFVEAYNTLYKTMETLTGTSKDEDTGEVTVGGLSTDGGAKTIVSQIRQMMTASVSGIDSGYTALTNLGIRTELDGTLSIDDDEFKTAIDDNFDLVGTLFSRQSSASNANVTVGYGSYVDKAVAGTYNVEVTTEPAEGSLNASTIDDAAVFAAFNTASVDYSFTISVDGTASNSISLPSDKTYSTADEMATELQSLINGDSLLKKANVAVDVVYNSTDDRFEFTSRAYGASSKVSFTAASTDMATLGISTSLTGTAGKDAAGTINGEAAFGSGNVLLPAVNSDPYGLNLTVEPGSLGTSTISYTRGLAGELSTLIDSVLSSTGTIKAREDSINDQLDGIKEDRTELDERMGKYEIRLLNQFLAMERIVSSFKTTGSSLDGILDRLPFTFQKS